MYTGLLHTHTLLRYFILLVLVAVVVISFRKWLGRKPYTNFDNKLSLYLLIFTHLQLVVGLILYFVSPNVKFNEHTMKDSTLRYWSVEHIFLMLVAITLITVARIGAKKISLDALKHKRMFIFNGVALLLIVVSIYMSGRGILHKNLF
ncbi:MAG: cytochrome B [Flammeovirgaceae bacterium]|nr:MAG: cytochrome B [Flammeovirgaceae bacterium]